MLALTTTYAQDVMPILLAVLGLIGFALRRAKPEC
jgi:hypothetical protein